MRKRASESAGYERAAQSPEYLAVGRVLRPHGVRGALLVEAISEAIYTLAPGQVVFLGEDFESAAVASLRAHRQQFLLALEGCRDRNQAERWRNAEVRIRLSESPPLPAGVYYHWQIVGLEVESDQGEPLGSVIRILETGANDVYIVKDQAGRELLLPAIEQVVKEVNLEEGRMIVQLLPGLLGSDLARDE